MEVTFQCVLVVPMLAGSSMPLGSICDYLLGMIIRPAGACLDWAGEISLLVRCMGAVL